MVNNSIARNRMKLIKHAPGAPGLRMFGLGPNLTPSKGLRQLQKLFDKHAFWAQKRSLKNLRKLLSGSSVVVSLWQGKRMIGFGRATSDGIYRAVLWDIVVADDLQGQGLGSDVVSAILSMKKLNQVERIYLMTTNGREFYQQIGFADKKDQSLLIKSNLFRKIK